MKKIIILLTLILLPISISAQCISNGSTVIYINGIRTSENDAKIDLLKLQTQYENRNNLSGIKFLNGYNSSHLVGGGDILKSVLQAYGLSGLDYDLTNILRQVHGELNTRKVLLVGHSQGTFYTNAAYEYLIKNGVQKDSISVYNIATPADRVAGDGNYLTSSTDKLIDTVVRGLIEIGSARKPLPSNIKIPLSKEEEEKPLGGHSLSGVYLAGASDRIISDMKKELDGLSPADFSEKSAGDCFVVPPNNLVHRLQGIGLAVGDGTANFIASSYKNSISAAQFAYKKAYSGLSYAYNFGINIWGSLASIFNNSGFFGASLISEPNQPAQKPEPDLEAGPPQTQQITEDINGFTGIGEQDPLYEIQDQIDDISEKIDILRRQIADLEKADKKKLIIAEKTAAIDEQSQNSKNNEVINQPRQPNILTYNNYANTSGGGGGPVYPKILISEVQIADAGDAKKEFVELYNPNSSDIELTGWYLQRKTKTGSGYSSYAVNNLFSGKNIAANGYFLIAREGYFAGLADFFVDNPLTDDNSLILKNPNGKISDKVGFGSAQEYETAPTQNPSIGQSIGRKNSNPSAGSGQEDTDNNSADFEFGNPTPKSQNEAYDVLPPKEPKDTMAPDFTFDNLSANQVNLSFTINFTITDPIGAVSPSGISSYIFRWKEESGDWQEDAVKSVDGNPATFSGTKEFSGNDEENYYFQIKAKDAAGNESDWLPETPATTKISLLKKVLINEIQIDSIIGKGGTDDDWVELYNPNDVDVSLNGWSIQKHSHDDPCSMEKSFYKKNFDSNSKIPKKGFFLVVGTEANDDLKNIADMTIGWSLSDNNTVYLVRSEDEILTGDDSNIVDKAGFGKKSCFPEGNPAPAPTDAKSIERKKLGLDTDDNSNDFKISDESSPKETFPKSTIEDATDYSMNPSSNFPGAPVYDVLLKWQSPSQNIDFFQVQYKLNDGQWKDWFGQTNQNQDYFQAVYSFFQDSIYYFRARTQDKEGNMGDWSDELKVDLTNPVIINEVAYAGTNADSNDQWIELYNTTDKDVDLTGWKIVSGPNNFNISLSGAIPAKGYFILENNDDNSLSDISASQIFTDKIGKKYLYLKAPNNRYVDEFYAPNSGLTEDSFIVDGNHLSSERVSAYSFGSLDKNWKLNNGKILNGTDRDGNQIYGTPGQENSVDQMYTYYSFSFIKDTTLKKELNPYLFNGDIQVFKNVNLTIEPGVVIKFYDFQSRLTVNGTLKVLGIDSDKIVFTSFYDDEFGGDSNDGSGTPDLPYPGSWLGLYFSPDSNNSELENIYVRYGGAVLGFSPFGWGNAVWIDRSLISLKNSILEKNKNRGLRLINSSSTIDTVRFLEHNTTDWPQPDESKAIYIQGGKPEIKNSFFKDNYYGIYIDKWHNDQTGEDILGDPFLENNQFEGSIKADIFNVNQPNG